MVGRAVDMARRPQHVGRGRVRRRPRCVQTRDAVAHSGRRTVGRPSVIPDAIRPKSDVASDTLTVGRVPATAVGLLARAVSRQTARVYFAALATPVRRQDKSPTDPA